MPPTLVFDRSSRARIELSGASAVATLNGLITNDVAALKPGQGQYAAALTAKGKIVADLYVLMLDDRLLLDVAPAAAVGLRDMLTKFVNPRFATRHDVTEETAELHVVGPRAAEFVAAVTGVVTDVLGALPMYSHVVGAMSETAIRIAHLPPVGAAQLPVFALLMPRAIASDVRSAIEALGATAGDDTIWNVLRVESGTPAWGADMDENTLPQEANLDELHAVSYTKGCYVGQETVARIHFRGHVNRSLRRIAVAGDDLVPEGASLLDRDNRTVGDVRSIAHSDALGVIGIAMIRREVNDGEALAVRWDGGGTDAMVIGKAKGAIG
jgi:folate-binding protein YgfZ